MHPSTMPLSDTITSRRYLQQNSIYAISHLEGVPELDTINLCNNQLRSISNLSCCSKLQTLLATHNQLESLESVTHLLDCPSIVTLDLSNNNLSDPAVLEVFKQMPNLRCLYLKGNPFVSSVKNYRKSLIAAIPNLGYLDDRPVFEDERRLVMAWSVGGVEGERAERQAIKEEKEAYDKKNFEAMQAIRKEGWRKRREALGLPPGDEDPALEGMDDEEYVFLEDPPELVEARKRLAAYSSREGEEEPPELSAARHEFAANGGVVAPGRGQGGENDGEIYFSAVKNSQQALLAAKDASEHSFEDDAKPVKDKSPVKEKLIALSEANLLEEMD